MRKELVSITVIVIVVIIGVFYIMYKPSPQQPEETPALSSNIVMYSGSEWPPGFPEVLQYAGLVIREGTKIVSTTDDSFTWTVEGVVDESDTKNVIQFYDGIFEEPSAKDFWKLTKESDEGDVERQWSLNTVDPPTDQEELFRVVVDPYQGNVLISYFVRNGGL